MITKLNRYFNGKIKPFYAFHKECLNRFQSTILKFSKEVLELYYQTVQEKLKQYKDSLDEY